MIEICTQKILDGITLTLRRRFPEAQIFDDEIVQDLRPGAFNVLLLSSMQQETLAGWHRDQLFYILYYPRNGREECMCVADTLCSVLNVISLPEYGKVRGMELNHEIVDNVLYFQVRYSYFLFRTEVHDTMNHLDMKGDVKHEGGKDRKRGGAEV